MSSSGEEDINQWVFHEGIRNRGGHVVPSSTEHITDTPGGTGLDAMEKVALYFGDHPDLPTVELGQIKEHEITLTFGGDVELDQPFRQVHMDYRDQWAIFHTDALNLITGSTYGHQTMALTAIGNSVSGAKIMFNTSRWQILGSVGMARFTRSFMVGQVMEQATEPWSREHHLWLVGYQELGRKLVSFLACYHDESRFHLVNSLDQVTLDDLAGTSATIYVMGSGPATGEAHERLKSAKAGMITDTVVTELAMFVSEDDDGGATVVNAGSFGTKVRPNLVGEGDPLHEAMETAWHQRGQVDQMARQLTQNLTVAEFLPTEAAGLEEQATTETISIEELEALMDRESYLPEHEREPVETVSGGATSERPTGDTGGSNTPAVADSSPAARCSMSLFGEPQIHTADGGVIGGKTAEAVAYLLLNGRSVKERELTRALWPAAEPGGRATRSRRARMASTLQDVLPDNFCSGPAWDIDVLPTDLEEVLTTLRNTSEPQEVTGVCSAIAPPLQGCAPWADRHRDRIMDRVRETLEEVTDTALENDWFELAKSARQAYKTL